MIQMIVSHAVSNGMMGCAVSEVVNITSIQYCPNKPASYEAKSDFAVSDKLVCGHGETLEEAVKNVYDLVKAHLTSRLINDAQQSAAEKFKQALADGIRRGGELRSALAEHKENHKRAALAQVAQSIQSGYLRGEELNSILEFNPEIAPLVEEILKIVNTAA